MKLRDYQTECVATIKHHFETSFRQLIQMPTGSGKTVTFLKYLSKYSKKSLIIVPTRELLEQIEDSALNFMHKSEIFAKYESEMTFKKHNVITAATLNYPKSVDKLLSLNVDTIVIDEAHRAQCNSYKNFIDKYVLQNPAIKILGFTATPERADKEPLLEIFHKLTFSRNMYDLIKQGHLCDMESYRIKTGQKFNTSKLTGNDFAPIAIKELDNESRNSLILKTYNENCQNKKTLVFCVNVEHAIKLAESFKKKGYKAEAIYGSLTKQQRKYIIQKFRTGEINVLFNCQLLTEGFDEPSIEALIIARPTKSKSLYCQMLGRGLRNFPGKEVCYLYELTDNVHNICTFNVAAEKERDFEYEYQNGTRLSNLKETLDGITLIDIHLVKEKINIYGDSGKNYLSHESATDNQIQLLKKQNITFYEPISVLEAGFLLWKRKLQVKYGKN